MVDHVRPIVVARWGQSISQYLADIGGHFIWRPCAVWNREHLAPALHFGTEIVNAVASAWRTFIPLNPRLVEPLAGFLSLS